MFQNTTYDFKDGSGPVPAHRHINRNGSLGGWVADTTTVARTVYIGEKAKVYGYATVLDNASVSGNVRISGDIVIAGDSCVYANDDALYHAKVFSEDSDTQNMKFIDFFSGVKKIFTDVKCFSYAIIAACVVLFCVAFYCMDGNDRTQLMSNSVNSFTNGVIIGSMTSSRYRYR